MLILSSSMVGFAAETPSSDSDELTSLRKYDIAKQEETIIEIEDSGIPDDYPRNSYGSSAMLSVDANFGPDAGMDAVIGADNRIRIQSTTSYPYYAIAYVRVLYTDGDSGHGTGFMVSPNVMMTAAHCVYEPGKTLASVTVYPGRNGGSIYGVTTAAEVYTDPGYTGSQPNLDYAILTLNSNIGNTTGWFSLYATGFEDLLNGKNISTAGYPGDKDNATMWFSTGQIYNTSNYRFDHNADTYSGQSGSPIYYYDSTYGYQVVGIHIRAGNSARKISPELFDWMVSEGYITA